MSCRIISNPELANTSPVNPPKVNRKIKPTLQSSDGDNSITDPCSEANHLKTLIPVGTAIIIVAAVK